MNTIVSILAKGTCVLAASAVLAAQEASDQQASHQQASPPADLPVGAYAIDGERVRATGDGFEAIFGPAGVEYRRERAPGDVAAALHLAYLGAARKGWQLPATPAPAQLTGKTVRLTRGPVVETYDLRHDGFEQSFVFATRPAGSGDLVVRLGVAGDVQAAAAAAAQQSLEFRKDDVPVIRYGEAYAFDRGGERIPVLTAYDGRGTLELIVPGAFVDRARLPLVIDPPVGPVFTPSGSSFNDNNPDVAHDVENGTYMVVWKRVFPASVGIRAQLYANDGTPIGGLIGVETAIGLDSPSVAFCDSLTDNAFLIVFSSSTGIRGRLYSSTSGIPLASSFAISNPATGESDGNPTVAGPGGSSMLVAWDRTPSGGTNANRIMVRGFVWQFPTIPTSQQFGGEHVVHQVTSGHLRRPRIGRSSVLVPVSGVDWVANRVTYEQFFTFPAPGDTDIITRSFRVHVGTSSYQSISSSFVPGGSVIGVSEIVPDIGSLSTLHQNPDDARFLIAWEDEGDVRGHLYDLNGPIGSDFDIRATTGAFEGGPAVAAGHCEFTVAYMEIVPPAEFDVDIYAARVLLDGTVPIDHTLVDNPGGQFQSSIRASSRPIRTVAGKEHNTTMITWMGQTGSSGSINDVRARLYEPVVPSIFPFGSACAGPLGELASIGTTNGPPIAGKDDFAITITGAPANSLAALVISDLLTTTPIPGAPGCNLYAGLPFIVVLPTITNGAGSGQVTVPIPCSIPDNTVLAFQWGIYTPGHNAFGWIVSNDIDIRWDH
jgi:hypothetical protein